jgi:hypothetical protein
LDASVRDTKASVEIAAWTLKIVRTEPRDTIWIDQNGQDFIRLRVETEWGEPMNGVTVRGVVTQKPLIPGAGIVPGNATTARMWTGEFEVLDGMAMVPVQAKNIPGVYHVQMRIGSYNWQVSSPTWAVVVRE